MTNQINSLKELYEHFKATGILGEHIKELYYDRYFDDFTILVKKPWQDFAAKFDKEFPEFSKEITILEEADFFDSVEHYLCINND